MKILRAYVDGVSVGESAFAGKPDINSDPVIIGNETPKYGVPVPLKVQ